MTAFDEALTPAAIALCELRNLNPGEKTWSEALRRWETNEEQAKEEILRAAQVAAVLKLVNV
jgi:hypothetical protein